MRLGVVCVASLLAAGCSFDGQPPPGALITCASTTDCPSRTVCSAEGHCVSDSRPIGSLALMPTLAGPGQKVHLEFTTTVTLSQAPLVRAVHRVSGATLAFPASTTGYELVVEPTMAEGSYQVLTDMKGVDGRVYLAVVLGDFALDLTAPSVGATRLSYQAPPDNLLVQAGFGDAVVAAGHGTTATLEFDTSEATTNAMISVLDADGGALGHLVRESASTPTQHRYSTTAEGLPDGRWRLEFDGHDAVGNRTLVVLPEVLSIDTTPPAAPSVDTPDVVTLRREGEGGPDAGRRPNEIVRVASGDITDDGVLVVTVNGAIAAASLMHPDAGDLTVSFSPAHDEPLVGVRYLDGAGNASPVVEVRDIIWVAWMGAGATPGSPHQLTPRLEQGPALVTAAEQGLRLPSSWPVEVQGGVHWEGPEWTGGSGAAIWLDLESATVRGAVPTTGPLVWDPVSCQPPVIATRGTCVQVLGANTDAGLVYIAAASLDLLRDEVVAVTTTGAFFRGKVDGGVLAGALVDAGAPLPNPLAMAYDYARDEVVMFGLGNRDAGVGPETWVWRDAWQRRSTPISPALRLGPAMASDPLRGGVWLQGGNASGVAGSFADLWYWNGSAWRKVIDSDAGLPSGLTTAAVQPTTGDVYVRVLQSTATTFVFDGGAVGPIGGGLPEPAASSWALEATTGAILGINYAWSWGLRGHVVANQWSKPGSSEVPPMVTLNDGTVAAISSQARWGFQSDGGLPVVTPLDASVAPSFQWAAVASDGGVFAADPTTLWRFDGSDWQALATLGMGQSVRGLTMAPGGPLLLSNTGNGAAALTTFDPAGALVDEQRIDHFDPLGLTPAPNGGGLMVLGSPLLVGSSGLQADGLAVATVVDGGVRLERIAVATSTEVPTASNRISVVATNANEVMVASGTGLRWLRTDARAPPSVVARAVTTGISLPAGAELREVVYQAFGGGDGASAGHQSAPGLDAFEYLDGHWVPLTPSTGPQVASSTAPALLSAAEEQPDVLRRLLRPGQSLGFALTAHRSFSSDPARVSVQWVAIEVHFRRPR
jgi:hypothetical protein